MRYKKGASMDHFQKIKLIVYGIGLTAIIILLILILYGINYAIDTVTAAYSEMINSISY